MDKFRSKTLHLLASLVLIFSSVTLSQQAIADQVSFEDKAPAMIGDLVFARPIGLIGTVLGSAVFVVSLPLTLLGGNVGEAAKALVIAPAKFTFVRPLGE
jgi:hypothetical protein